MTLDYITAISTLVEKTEQNQQAQAQAQHEQQQQIQAGNSPVVKFEGIEKRLEICLRRTGTANAGGMRNATFEFWTKVLDLIHAKILDVKSTDKMDGYILSESSLFVSALSVTLITCGTTKLLNCVELLLEGIEEQNLEVEWVSYSRKNFMYPWVQPAPHCSLASEYAILRKHFPEGNSFILGPLDGDHYFFYLMDKVDRPGKEERDQQLKILMFDLDKDVCKQYYHDEMSTNSQRTQEVRQISGLDGLFKGFSVVQDTQFEPCGYSVNALRGTTYCTIHVTPEVDCSYASFETTISVKCYTELVRAVLDIFKPGRFVIHMFLDEHSEAGINRAQGESIGIENAYAGYNLVNYSINEFQPGYVTGAATFEGKATFVT